MRSVQQCRSVRRSGPAPGSRRVGRSEHHEASESRRGAGGVVGRDLGREVGGRRCGTRPGSCWSGRRRAAPIWPACPSSIPSWDARSCAPRPGSSAVHVVAGLAEGPRERWHNTSAIIDPSGAVLYSQTKNYPTAGEVDGGVVPGDSFEVVETRVGRLGIVICADFAFFKDGVETSRHERADILLNPALWFALERSIPAHRDRAPHGVLRPGGRREPGAIVRDFP